jgi:hypothetical protein
MGIAGAALYSLALIAGRELVRLPAHVKHALRGVWRPLLEGAAHCGASLHPASHAEIQKPISKR